MLEYYCSSGRNISPLILFISYFLCWYLISLFLKRRDFFCNEIVYFYLKCKILFIKIVQLKMVFSFSMRNFRGPLQFWQFLSAAFFRIRLIVLIYLLIYSYALEIFKRINIKYRGWIRMKIGHFNHLTNWVIF